MVTLQEIKDQIAKYLYLTDTNVVDVTLAFVIANRLPGDGVCLYIVGPSSSAKTEMINCIGKNPHVEKISIITPHALVSGYKEKGKTEDNSVLTRLQAEDKNILAFKEFTTIISMRREDRAAFMAQIRELADGEISGTFGNKQKMVLKSKFGVIAACTNAIDEFSAGIAILGERFLKYRITAEMADEIADAAKDTGGVKDQLRDEAATMCKLFLDSFDNAILFEDPPTWEEACWEKVKNLCILGSHLRTQIIRDEKGIQHGEVDHEGPGRLVASMSKIAKALAIVRGKKIIDMSLYPVLKKIVRDTMLPFRLRIVEMIYESKGSMKEVELSKRLCVPRNTIKRYCLDLVSVRICERTSVERVEAELYIRDEYIKRIENSEIFIIDQL